VLQRERERVRELERKREREEERKDFYQINNNIMSSQRALLAADS
jgi:hypothetical protein